MSSITLSDDALSEWPEESPSLMTEEEFVDWIGRIEGLRAEWVDGEVELMSPASVRHFQIFGWLYRILATYVEERDLGAVLGLEYMVRLRPGKRISRRVPDLMFVTKDRQQLITKNHLEGPPDLAAEIVSFDSQNRDWKDKLKEYETAGVREYWIIDPATQQFEAFKPGVKKKFVSFYAQPAGLFTSEIVPGFQFQIEWLWEERPPSPLTVLRGLGIIT